MSFAYNFVKYSGRLALPLFFGRLEINGSEHIPKDAPFIIAPNHQNAFLDAVLMGVYLKKEVHFLTRSDVFVPPFISMLSALNMMPVYRIRDGYEKLSKNDEIFARCRSLLNNQKPVLIFPEGNMDEGHFLRPLTKGISRLAFQSQSELNEDLFILPVGINYFHHYRPRHKCIINFGQPINVTDFINDLEKSKPKALIKLRNTITEGIKELMLIPEKEDYDKKLYALNRANEHLPFKELKKQIQNNAFRRVNYFRWPRSVRTLLTIFNPAAIILVNHILKNVIGDKQFTSSLKYTLGLVFSAIWWLIIFVVGWLYIGIFESLFITSFVILMLFVRADLAKFIDPLGRI